MQQGALQAILRAWPTEDLDGAGQLVLSLPNGSVRTELLKTLGEEWRTQAVDASGLLQLASRFAAGADRDAFLAGASSEWMHDHPEEAARLVAAMTTADTQSQSAEITAICWARSNPDAAAVWATGLPEGPRNLAVLSVAKEWAGTDPEAASHWLQTLPADAQRTAAVDAFMATTMKVRPDLAAAWVSTILDDTKRAGLIQKIGSAWLRVDPHAARAWLESSLSNNSHEF
jgi:hypothetical protein